MLPSNSSTSMHPVCMAYEHAGKSFLEISWHTVIMYALLGAILMVGSLCLILAVYRSKVIASHMAGILLANLALVGVVSFWTDVATEFEREIMMQSVFLGRIGCHFLLNLTMIIKTEFHFMIILLGLDRILVMENKVFYDGKAIYKILVTVIPWCVSFTLALGLYFITQGSHISFQPLDYDKCYKAACYIMPTHLGFNTPLYINCVAITVPTFILSVVVLIVGLLWYKTARAGLPLEATEKAINVAYVVSAATLLCGNTVESAIETTGVNMTLWLIVEPLIMVYWLTLVPDLKDALSCKRERDEEGATLLESEQRQVDPVDV